MTRDYKHARQASRNEEGPPIPAWVWLAGGFVLGFGTAMGVTWLQQSDTELPDFALEPPPAPEREEEEEDEDERFSFYRMLERFEVTVPETDLELRRDRDRDESVPELDTEGSFLLQVASFQSESDADRMRANLTLAGYNARINRVEVDDGQTYYRVHVGPIDSPEEVERTLERLEDDGMEPLVIRQQE